jgi:hypothetical protein
MAEKKEPKTVEEIVKHYHGFHHTNEKKSFDDRIKAFENLHDPDNTHIQTIAQHGKYILNGKPTDPKTFPGAFNEAYKKVDKYVKEDGDKLEDIDKLADILETLTDTFMKKAHPGYDKALEHMKKKAQKEGKKLDKKALRELKGAMLSQQYLLNDEGNGPGDNILSESYLKGLKKKNKLQLIERLEGLSQKLIRGYVGITVTKMQDGWFDDHKDRVSLADYLDPVFKARGWKNDRSGIYRSATQQIQSYKGLMSGDAETLGNVGYTPLSRQKEKKEAEAKKKGK